MSDKIKSRKDEIIRILNKHEKFVRGATGGYYVVENSEYGSVATEIEKIYEGKVEYVVQKWFTPRYRKTGSWIDDMKSESMIRSDKYYHAIKTKYSMIKFRIIKRTTTDQVISDDN